MISFAETKSYHRKLPFFVQKTVNKCNILIRFQVKGFLKLELD